MPGAVPGNRVLGKSSRGLCPEGPPGLEMLTDVDREGGQRHPAHPGECQPGPQWPLVGSQEKGVFRWKLSEKRELGRRGGGAKAPRQPERVLLGRVEGLLQPSRFLESAN